MGLWVPEPTLELGEEVLVHRYANHTQGRRAIGGRLTVTDRALRFRANRVDRLLGGRDLDIERAEVRSVTTADRSLDGGPFTGGIRRRLEVVTTGASHWFVVSNADAVGAELAGLWELPVPPGTGSVD